jgi:hypothetical protein
MNGNFWHDWPAYLIIGVLVFSLIYIILQWNEGGKDNQGQDKSSGTK